MYAPFSERKWRQGCVYKKAKAAAASPQGEVAAAHILAHSPGSIIEGKLSCQSGCPVRLRLIGYVCGGPQYWLAILR